MTTIKAKLSAKVNRITSGHRNERRWSVEQPRLPSGLGPPVKTPIGIDFPVSFLSVEQGGLR